MGILNHKFGSRYARKPTMDSRDVHCNLVSKKTLSQKMACWVGSQGQVNLANKVKTCPHYDVTHRNPKPKTKKCFSIWTRRLDKLRGFQHLYSLIGWWVTVLQTLQKVVHMGHNSTCYSGSSIAKMMHQFCWSIWACVCGFVFLVHQKNTWSAKTIWMIYFQ